MADEWNRSSSNGNPIIVICRNGVDCSGIFCTAYCIIERMKLLNEVAIFSTIKYLRSFRKQFIIDEVKIMIFYKN